MSLCVACAAPGALDEARKAYSEGRGEEALRLLSSASRQHPEDATLRAEYFRLRDMLVGQWLAQAELLRQAGQFDGAEPLYRRVQTYDPANARASAGFTS